MKGRNWNPALLPIPRSLHEVLAAYPELTADGWPTRSGRRARIDPGEFVLASAFIAAFGRPLRCFNNRRGSYGLKKTAQHWMGGECISNGAFIAAALAYGFRHRVDGEGSPNCRFNMDLLRRGRPLHVLLSSDEASLDVVSYDVAIQLTVVHAWADELRAPFRTLWEALDAVAYETDPAAIGMHFDAVIKRWPGDSPAAFGRVLRKAAR